MRRSFYCYFLIVGCALGFLTNVDSFFFNNNQHPAAKAVKQNLPVVKSKEDFLNSLDNINSFNDATKERSELLSAMTLDNPTTSPGSISSFAPVASGTWRIVYAPHIYTGGKLIGGSFSPVVYILEPTGEMISHAKYNLPFIGSGWLSVSGTYGSEDDDKVCRVDFDKAWIKMIKDDDGGDDSEPYSDLDSVPSSLAKEIINALGRFFFIDSVSIFPVSYLDKDTIVFDFELLGTRICARKISPRDWLN